MAYDEKELEKLVSLVLTAACTMVVTVAPVFADAASTPAYSPVEASTVDSLLSSSVQWVGQSLMTYSDDDLANMEASDQQFYARAAEAWEEAKADLGEVKSLEDGTLEVDGDFVTCTIPGEFEKILVLSAYSGTSAPEHRFRPTSPSPLRSQRAF